MSIKVEHNKPFTNRFKPIVQDNYPLKILSDRGMVGNTRRVYAECTHCLLPFGVKLSSIKAGTTTKCRSCANSISSTTHGESNSPLHKVWVSMRQRCYNPKNTHYEYYGGIGVTVCKEWKDSFVKFRDWALANGYKEGLTIDKDFLKPTDGTSASYSPDTCVWATRQEQATYRNSVNKSNSSGYSNVKRDSKRNKWEVSFMYKSKKYFVGRFDCIDEAVKARDKKKKEIIT